MNPGMRRLTALYDVRLQRKLFVTQPVGSEPSNPSFTVALDGLDVTLNLVLDDLPRIESPNRGILIRQVSRVEIRATRFEPLGVPSVIPIPEDGPELQAWSEAHGKRVDEYTRASLTILNRLLGFFKYGLRNPLLEPYTFLDLVPPAWIDEKGQVIETGLAAMKATRSPPAYLENTLLPERETQLRYCLQNDITPSLVDEILLDAMGALAEKNLRQAIIEAAVCCEVATKQALSVEYLEATNQDRSTVPELLDRVARERLGRSFKDFNPQRHRDIDFLFRARNRAAHRGETIFRDDQGNVQTVTRQVVQEWLISAQHLLVWLEQCRASEAEAPQDTE